MPTWNWPLLKDPLPRKITGGRIMKVAEEATLSLKPDSKAFVRTAADRMSVNGLVYSGEDAVGSELSSVYLRVEEESGCCKVTETEPTNEPPFGTITGGASAGVPGRPLIQSVIRFTASISMKLRARGGILVPSFVPIRSSKPDRQTSLGVTTRRLSAPR